MRVDKSTASLARIVTLTALLVGAGLAAAALLGPEPPVIKTETIPDFGTTGDVDWSIPSEKIGEYKRRALAGDNDAADALGNHYAALEQRDDERRWRGVAARRGDCQSMALLKESYQFTGDLSGAGAWNEQLRRHRCTVPVHGKPGKITELWDDADYGKGAKPSSVSNSQSQPPR